MRFSQCQFAYKKNYKHNQTLLEMSKITTIDQAICQKVYAIRTIRLTQIMKIITVFGEQGLFALVATGSIILVQNGHKSIGLHWLLMVVVGIIGNFVLKSIFRRNRPSTSPLIHEPFWSFPSGHATSSTVGYGYGIVIAKELMQNIAGQNLVIGGLLGLIVVICFSRVYLGVHYPSDVIAGVICGMLLLQF